MSKSLISQINDLLKLYKSLLSNKSKKDGIELYLKTILNDLEVKFEIYYKMKIDDIKNIESNNITFGAGLVELDTTGCPSDFK
jgi:hypothetical protein